jgi:hypothetical protein
MPTESTDEPTQSLIGRNETMEIQRTGYRAYLAGQPFTTNPYTRESAESIERQTAWFRGYAMSKTDRARANRAAAAADPAGTNTSDVP